MNRACVGVAAALLLGLSPATRADVGPGGAIDLTLAQGDECLASGASWNLSGAFTIEAWIWIDGLTSNAFNTGGGIVTYASGNSSPYALWAFAGAPGSPIANANLALQLNYVGGAGSFFLQSSTHLPISTWVHVAATYDGATAKTYINGHLSSSAPYAAPINQLATGSFALGNNFPGVSEFIDGQIDEVRVWTVALSEQQIQDTMSAPLCGDEAGLFAYWDFNEADGQVVTDRSGHGRDLFLGTGTAIETSDPARVASSAPVSAPDANANGVPDACDCVADLDGDADTDIFDFGIFATHFGAFVPAGTDGDYDADGRVTIFDFGIFAVNFGCGI